MGLINDASGAPFGSTDTVINTVTYPTEEIQFDENIDTQVRKDSVGLPNGAFHIDQPITGRMTLQLLTGSTAVPARGSLAALTFRGASKNFYITKVSQPQRQGELRKIQVEIFEKLT